MDLASIPTKNSWTSTNLWDKMTGHWNIDRINKTLSKGKTSKRLGEKERENFPFVEYAIQKVTRSAILIDLIIDQVTCWKIL